MTVFQIDTSKSICSINWAALALFFQILFVSCAQREEYKEAFQLRDDTGIDFNNVIEEKYDTFFEFFPYVYNGGGVAAGDINNDGLVDLYFSGNEVQDKLYLNQGNFKFKDISESYGIDKHGGW